MRQSPRYLMLPLACSPRYRKWTRTTGSKPLDSLRSRTIRIWGKLTLLGLSCSSGSCEVSLGNTSLPLVVPSNESSLVATRVSPSQSATTTLIDTNNDDDPERKLDCEWPSRRVQSRVAMLALSSVVGYSHTAYSGGESYEFSCPKRCH